MGKIDRKLAEALIKRLKSKFPHLPEGKYWTKNGKKRIYFNSRKNTFYLNFSKERVYLNKYNERFWFSKSRENRKSDIIQVVNEFLDNKISSAPKKPISNNFVQGDFCPNCDTILIPKRRKGISYCPDCDKSYENSTRNQKIEFYKKGDKISVRTGSQYNQFTGRFESIYEEYIPSTSVDIQTPIKKSCRNCLKTFSTYDDQYTQCKKCR